MRRFNLFFIYLPVGFAAIVAVGLTILLLVVSLGSESSQALLTISAIADSVIILTIIPTLILCAIVPTAFLAITLQMKSRGQAPIGRTQWFLWNIQDRLEMIALQISSVMEKVREPFIRITSRYAFVRAFFSRLLSIFKRR